MIYAQNRHADWVGKGATGYAKPLTVAAGGILIANIWNACSIPAPFPDTVDALGLAWQQIATDQRAPNNPNESRRLVMYAALGPGEPAAGGILVGYHNPMNSIQVVVDQIAGCPDDLAGALRNPTGVEEDFFTSYAHATLPDLLAGSASYGAIGHGKKTASTAGPGYTPVNTLIGNFHSTITELRVDGQPLVDCTWIDLAHCCGLAVELVAAAG